MKPRPRIRKTVKWGGAAASVLLLVVWVGSGWWGAAGDLTNGVWISVWWGQVKFGRSLERSQEAPQMDWDWVQADFRLQWGWNARHRTGDWWVTIPLWAPAALTLAATVLAWRLDTLARRRARVGLCPKCRYDRAGLPAGAVCPECGALP